MRKLWEVSRHCCDMQVDLQHEGITCWSVAYQIHKYQVEQGVQKYIYHRPALEQAIRPVLSPLKRATGESGFGYRR